MNFPIVLKNAAASEDLKYPSLKHIERLVIPLKLSILISLGKCQGQHVSSLHFQASAIGKDTTRTYRSER